MKKEYWVIGLMSGSSLDGLDIALCRFEAVREVDSFFLKDWELLKAETLPFSAEWQEILKKAPSGTARELIEAHVGFGRYMGELALQFFNKNNLKPGRAGLIASHGHTVFHEPANGYTLQIGDGAALSAVTGCTVVCDFRSSDVALGGQGAPLAPMADKMLFPGYDFFLNIGGIANLACNTGRSYIAFDLTGANQALNALAKLVGRDYDEDGSLAASGHLDEELFSKLNALPYLNEAYPKSLSNQWVQKNMTQLCLSWPGSVPDRLHSLCRHIAFQVKNSLQQIIEREHFIKEKYRMLATGGGAFNSFLMQCIAAENPMLEIIIPEPEVVSFKEACLMALLGMLRMEGAPNCMASVSGASRDAIGGAVYLPA